GDRNVTGVQTCALPIYAAQPGPGAPGRGVHSRCDVCVVDQRAHLPACDERVVQPASRIDVVVLNIDQRHPRIRPLKAPSTIAAQQRIFRGPVQPVGGAQRVSGKVVQDLLPQFQNALLVTAELPRWLQRTDDLLADPTLQLDRGSGGVAVEPQRGLQLQIAGDPADIFDRIDEHDVAEIGPRLNGLEYQRGGAEAQVGRELAQVRIADDDVEAAPIIRGGVVLVSGI